jgi:hypothetical protein
MGLTAFLVGKWVVPVHDAMNRDVVLVPDDRWSPIHPTDKS